MVYRQKHDTFIRQYTDVGYIENETISDNRVFDASGAFFLLALSREPQSLERLVDKISDSFIGIDRTALEKDVAEFYLMLEADGFIVSGETSEELNNKDICFSYKSFKSQMTETDSIIVPEYSKKTTDDFLQEHFKNNPQLIGLHIDLTNHCNERCVHCYVPHKEKDVYIDPALFYDVLEQCSEMGVIKLTFSGGEALSHPHFLDFLDKAHEFDFSIAILSNLTLLNDQIIGKMKTDHISLVQVSLYSMKPEIHDSITQLPGSFYKTRDAIFRLIDADINLRIACPILKQNKDDYNNVQEWGQEHNIAVFNNYNMLGRYDNTTDNLNNRLTLDEAGKMMLDSLLRNDRMYQKEKDKYDYMARNNHDFSDVRICNVGIDSISMSANGNVHPCTGWNGMICGNLNNQSLRDIWNNSSQLNYLRGLRWRDFPKCVDCTDKPFCTFCLMRNANGNQNTSKVWSVGDPLIIDDYTCNNAIFNRKIVLDWKEKLRAVQLQAAQ